MSAWDALVEHPTPDDRDQLKAQISELGQRGVLGALTVRGRLRKELEQLGVRRSRTSNAPVWALAGLLLIAAGSATVGAVTHSLSAQTAVGRAADVLTVAGLLVAVLQWRLG